MKKILLGVIAAFALTCIAAPAVRAEGEEKAPEAGAKKEKKGKKAKKEKEAAPAGEEKK
jgi:hypothetical protein